jgi:nucleoside-diphosphate-sugar epimerase
VASALDAAGHATRFNEAGGTGVVLRFGLFYGPDSHHTTDTIAGVRRRFPHFPLGRPDTWLSSLHLDDAGTAVAAALLAPAGAWNVVDDEPVTRRHYLDSLAAALGAAPVRYPGAVLARLAGRRADVLARSQRVSNRRFREATGWAPMVSSVDHGWPLVVAALEEPSCAAG